MYSTRLFAERVMPALRGMWPDYAGDDRFWCHPLENPVTPAPLARGFAAAPACGAEVSP
jgi:hypothetical protein